MKKFKRRAITAFLLLLCSMTKEFAGFYPGVGSDVSFTDQNQTFYTLYGKLVNAPSYNTYIDAGSSHEGDFT